MDSSGMCGVQLGMSSLGGGSSLSQKGPFLIHILGSRQYLEGV
jgi:hypothetical protein